MINFFVDPLYIMKLFSNEDECLRYNVKYICIKYICYYPNYVNNFHRKKY